MRGIWGFKRLLQDRLKRHPGHFGSNEVESKTEARMEDGKIQARYENGEGREA
jgi:hypothetical protein